MKLLLSFAAVLFACGVAVADDTAKAEKKQALEGTWTVVCAEKGGEPMPDAKGMTVSVKDGVMTCNCPKTGATIRVECTSPGKAKVSVSETKDGKGEMKEANYILTTDYLAVCIHDPKSDKPDSEQPKDGEKTAFQPTCKSACSLILHRGSVEKRDVKEERK